MADEPEPAEETIFLDTSLVVAATVEAHPSHIVSGEFIDEIVGRGARIHISPQVCREFLVVLTRQPVSGRVFTIEEAYSSLSVWMTGCTILEESEAVLTECLDLARRFGVHGKQIHDCNIAATMRVHGVRALATRNPADFKRYAEHIVVLGLA